MKKRITRQNQHKKITIIKEIIVKLNGKWYEQLYSVMAEKFKET
jgi:hypothetical protein